jgi:hypothetical protein
MDDEAIARASQALAEEATVRGLLERACGEFVDALGARACAVSRVVGDLLVLLAHKSDAERPLGFGHEYLISDYPLTSEAITLGEPRAVSLLDENPEEMEAKLLEQFGFESLLMVCLPSGGRCWGLVEVYASGKTFGDEDAALADELATVAGRRLEAIEP